METYAGRYLSLTSFKRDGTGVATPVWFVADNGNLLVETDADSYKMKRIRRDPHVTIALSDARGKLRGEPVDATATILPDAERVRVEHLLAKKYRIDRWTVYPVYRLVMKLRGRGSHTDEAPVALAITPARPPPPPAPVSRFRRPSTIRSRPTSNALTSRCGPSAMCWSRCSSRCG
jgi:PPOX class probable F420-dependent enzyme